MSGLTTLAGQRIRLARKQAGWTLRQLAEATDYSASHLSEVERGVSPITLALLETVGMAFCLSPLWFLDVQDAEQERTRRVWYARCLSDIRRLIPQDIAD